MHLVPIDREGNTSATSQSAAEVVGQVIEATVGLYERRGYLPPWIGYLAVEDGQAVGTCGFAGPPAAGEAEVAYFTFPGNEGRGVARRMASKLMQLTGTAATQGGVQYIAHTLPADGPSTSILKALHFRLEGEIQHPEDGRVWKWRHPSPPDA